MKQDVEISSLIGYQINMARLPLMEAARTSLQPFGMTPAKVTALALIKANPGCNQSALAKGLSINRGNAMKMVNSLAALGYVERGRGADDRSHALYVTEKADSHFSEMLIALKRSESRVSEQVSTSHYHQMYQLARLIGKKASSNLAAGEQSAPGLDRLER